MPKCLETINEKENAVMDNYTNLTFDLIEEGRLKGELEDELAKVMTALCRYRKKYGDEARGAKAQVVLKVTLKIEDPKDEFYSVVSTLESKMPGRPQRATLAIEGTDEKGRPILFSRKSGSSGDHPDQQRLCTDAGETIDQDTGEIIPNEPADDTAAT